MAVVQPVPRAPRKGCVDVFNEFMLDGVELAGYYKIPVIKPTDKIPERIVPFSEAVCGRERPAPGPGCISTRTT